MLSSRGSTAGSSKLIRPQADFFLQLNLDPAAPTHRVKPLDDSEFLPRVKSMRPANDEITSMDYNNPLILF